MQSYDRTPSVEQPNPATHPDLRYNPAPNLSPGGAADAGFSLVVGLGLLVIGGAIAVAVAAVWIHLMLTVGAAAILAVGLTAVLLWCAVAAMTGIGVAVVGGILFAAIQGSGMRRRLGSD